MSASKCACGTYIQAGGVYDRVVGTLAADAVLASLLHERQRLESGRREQ